MNLVSLDMLCSVLMIYYCINPCNKYCINIFSFLQVYAFKQKNKQTKSCYLGPQCHFIILCCSFWVPFHMYKKKPNTFISVVTQSATEVVSTEEGHVVVDKLYSFLPFSELKWRKSAFLTIHFSYFQHSVGW